MAFVNLGVLRSRHSFVPQFRIVDVNSTMHKLRKKERGYEKENKSSRGHHRTVARDLEFEKTTTR
jgi:hypothetical protein